MNEKDLLDKIKQSAEKIDFPDSVMPENVYSALQNKKFSDKKIHKFRSHFSFRNAFSAAAVLILCGILTKEAFRTNQIAPESSIQTDMSQQTKKSTSKEIIDTETVKEEITNEEILITPKQNAGNLYTVAKSYEQIYDKLEASYYNSVKEYEMEASPKFFREDLTMENSISDTSDGASNEEIQNSYSFSDYDKKMVQTESASKKENYSTTNLQTVGVDESDIIKTDGRFIYTVADRKIIVTDTSGNNLKSAGTINPNLDSFDSIEELFVDNNYLILLVSHCDTSLEEKTSVSEEDLDSGFLPLEDKKMNYVSSDYSTVLYIYDITDPFTPVLKGTGTQEGFYYTSRKIDNILYLFTQKHSLAQPAYYEDKEAEGGIIPCVNGKQIPYNHIYLPSEGSSSLILSSFQIDKPEEAIDEVMIIHNSVNVYVGNNSIYLYNPDFTKSESTTQIAKFEMKNGIINAVNASSIRGEIYDTFAINEYQNTLRVLSTYYDNNGNSSNYLYLFDENMKLASSIDGIANGEEIYAARYLGNTAYFITYRNTDPLFAVDLSDIKNPKLLGELKITGFSEYLHFWEEDKLLGIGYETDPDTGERKGMKLVMFDISNPVDLKVIDSKVLKEYYFSPALYNYKCILVSPQKNLIGFAAEYNSTENDSITNYNIFSWENDHFANKLKEQLSNNISSDSIRGIYIEDHFFIADLKEITGFDMNNNFEKKSNLKLNETK